MQTQTPRPSRLYRLFYTLRKRRSGVMGLALALVIVASAIFAPILSPLPTKQAVPTERLCSPDGRTLVRHGFARARPLLPRPLGRTNLVAARPGSGGHRLGARRKHRHLERFSRWYARPDDNSGDRHPVGLPRHPPSHIYRGDLRDEHVQHGLRHRYQQYATVRSGVEGRGHQVA